MKKLLLSLSLGLLVTGCGSVPKVSEAKGAIVPPEKIVKIQVVSMDVNQAQKGLCPKIGADLSKYKLKELILMGNSCIQVLDWARLEEVGFATNKKEPFQPWGSYFLSMAAEARGDLPKAKWMIELGIKKNPSYGILYYQKGRLFWLDKNFAESLTLVKKSVEMDPGLVDGHVFLAQVYFRDQEFEKASEHYYTVLKVRPNNFAALSGLAESRRYRNDFAGAMEVLNRAINYYPEAIEFQWRQAQIYELNLNDKVNALNAYIQLKRKLIRNPSKLIGLAEVEAKIRQIESRRPAVSAAKNDKGATP